MNLTGDEIGFEPLDFGREAGLNTERHREHGGHRAEFRISNLDFRDKRKHAKGGGSVWNGEAAATYQLATAARAILRVAAEIMKLAVGGFAVDAEPIGVFRFERHAVIDLALELDFRCFGVLFGCQEISARAGADFCGRGARTCWLFRFGDLAFACWCGFPFFHDTFPVGPFVFMGERRARTKIKWRNPPVRLSAAAKLERGRSKNALAQANGRLEGLLWAAALVQVGGAGIAGVYSVRAGRADQGCVAGEGD